MPQSISEYVPQFVSGEEAARIRRAALAAWGAAASVSLLFVAAVVLAPWTRANGHPLVAEVVYRGFSVVCHQMPERSFHVAGFPLAVCARCFGLYAGCAAGVLLYPFARGLTWREPPARAWLMAAVLPTSIDFALGFFGIWENTHLSRFVTAVLLGATTAFFIVPGLLDLSYMRRRRPVREHSSARA